MPAVHLGHLQLFLEKGASEWQVFLSPQPDSHWVMLKPNYAWAFQLMPLERHDLVELRLPARFLDHDQQEYAVRAETVVLGELVGVWTRVGDWLCSDQFASPQALYVRVEVTPTATNLPLAIPNKGTARGGGHFYVKTAGGGDKTPAGGGT